MAEKDAPAPPVSRNVESVFTVGDRIGGRYEVHRILSGMGTVYVVYDHRDRNVLALKTVQSLADEKPVRQPALPYSRLPCSTSPDEMPPTGKRRIDWVRNCCCD